MAQIAALCVFCGSSTPPDPRYADTARALGTLVAGRGIDLVYGGGSVGLMGEIADAALAAGGRVLGVIPTGLFSREVAHPALTELREVGSMHERKQLMYDLSDGFVALPGGLGTLEELAEVTTWSQLGLHAKPVGLLDQANRELIQRAATPEDALTALAAAHPPREQKWITPSER